MAPVIHLENLSKSFGPLKAVQDLSLTIEEGEIFGLLGPNGAGKTTTILMILGLVEPTSGKAWVAGFDATREAQKVKEVVGYLPDQVGFYSDMTGLENLKLTGRLNGLTEGEAEKEALLLLQRVGLQEAALKPAGTYSRGMRQRLGLADTLIKRPKIIILDEPTLGIDPEGVREFLALIRELSREEKLTVLLSSHHLHQVQAICDRVGIFVKGRLVAQGTVAELSREILGEDAYSLTIAGEPLSEAILQAIAQIPGVTGLRREDGTLTVTAREDVAPALARTLIEKGFRLERLEPQHYGLDEIYHRYFEGGV
ncbi:MAG: ABC transporter ATP-binding protein [Bacillota bacterium]|nr:ABC transporter ATP-binding protein [Bacillota bacterium]